MGPAAGQAGGQYGGPAFQGQEQNWAQHGQHGMAPQGEGCPMLLIYENTTFLFPKRTFQIKPLLECMRDCEWACSTT